MIFTLFVIFLMYNKGEFFLLSYYLCFLLPTPSPTRNNKFKRKEKSIYLALTKLVIIEVVRGGKK